MTKKKSKNTDSFLSPESSNVEGGQYDREIGHAVIAFRDKKNPDAETVYYVYGRDKKVTQGDWQALKSVSSKGTFVKGYFSKIYKGELMS